MHGHMPLFLFAPRVKMSGWKQPGCSPGTPPRPWWPKLSATSHSLLGFTLEQPSWRQTSVPRSGFFGKVSLPGPPGAGCCVSVCGCLPHAGPCPGRAALLRGLLRCCWEWVTRGGSSGLFLAGLPLPFLCGGVSAWLRCSGIDPTPASSRGATCRRCGPGMVASAGSEPASVGWPVG